MKIYYISFVWIFLMGYLFTFNNYCNKKENKNLISDTIIFESDFLKNLNFNKPKIKNCKLIYNEKLDEMFLERYKCGRKCKIDIYIHFRGEYFTPEEVKKKDYIINNGKKYLFDKLVSNNELLYSQSVDIIEINKFSFNSNNYITLYIRDAFIMGANSLCYIYIFNISNDNNLIFIGVMESQLSISDCMGDFNNDDNMDFFQWTRYDTIGNVYSIIDNKLKLNKNMYLNCIRLDTGFGVPAIIKNKSKFPLLNGK